MRLGTVTYMASKVPDLDHLTKKIPTWKQEKKITPRATLKIKQKALERAQENLRQKAEELKEAEKAVPISA